MLKLSQRARKQLRERKVSMIWKKSKYRLIPELEELMTCSCQSDTKFDQASLQVESETGRSVLEQWGCAFPACSTPDQKSKSFKRYERRSTISLLT